ncbi:hypothetical protein HDG69_002378 [Isoptericola halotolerans]|uniref:Uncharacterized protein n=1 Tax=Isoptericola halotolerans TaxID=300560 RepID=A0ABX2A7C2_9MICO|nr:hypothetical protein [Isoptericola halotolerans]
MAESTKRPVPRLGPRRVVALVAGATVAAVLVVIAVLSWGDDDGPTSGAAVDPARVAELERAEVERNEQTLEALAEFGLELQDELSPVLEGLQAAEPPDGSSRREPTAEELDRWRGVLDALATDAEALPLGATEHNMVRRGFALTVEMLGSSVDLVEQGSAADPPTAGTLYGLSGDVRGQAVDAFGMAAMQLDLLYIAADKGHLHVVLRAGEDGAPIDDPHAGHGH